MSARAEERASLGSLPGHCLQAQRKKDDLELSNTASLGWAQKQREDPFRSSCRPLAFVSRVPFTRGEAGRSVLSLEWCCCSNKDRVGRFVAGEHGGFGMKSNRPLQSLQY
jgi:hypothetical protein